MGMGYDRRASSKSGKPKNYRLNYKLSYKYNL